MSDPNTDRPKYRWLAELKKWPNIRLVLEFFVSLSIFFDLIPTHLRDNLKETGLGIVIVFGTIIICVLFDNMQQSKVFSNYYHFFENKITTKENEILSLSDKNELLQKNVDKLSNYSHIFTLTNKAFAQIRSAHREDVKANNDQKLRGAINQFCNTLHEIFQHLKGAEGKICHVCIKVFVKSTPGRNQKRKDPVKIKLKTFMRDGRGNGKRDLIDERKDIEHFVDDNYDFLQILEQSPDQNIRHFLANDLLLLDDDYKNSSLKVSNKDGSPHFKYAHASMEEKIKHWKLPYRSVIVGAICPGISKPNYEDGTFIGLICVDYDVPNQFEPQDVDIVIGFSEGLYEVLDHYIQTYLT